MDDAQISVKIRMYAILAAMVTVYFLAVVLISTSERYSLLIGQNNFYNISIFVWVFMIMVVVASWIIDKKLKKKKLIE